MSIRHRLERLEKVYGGGGGLPPCDGCGGGGSGDDDDAAYELTFPGDHSDDDLGAEPQEEFCAACGRQLSWVLSFPDEQDTRPKWSSVWRR